MRFQSLLLTALLASGVALGQPPETPTEVRERLTRVHKKLKMSKQKLAEANHQEDKLAHQLGETRALIEDFSQKLREVEHELELAKSRHEEIRKQVQDSREKLRRKRRALGRRLREMEVEGSANYLQVLLQARSFTQFVTYGEYVQRLLASEKKLIAAVKKERQNLERRRDAAQRTVNEIRGLEADYSEKVSALKQVQGRQTELLTKLSRNREKLEAYVDGLEHLSQAMEQKLVALIKDRSAPTALGPIVPGNGHFIYPVSGPITSPFGYRVHPVTGTTRFHSGLDFGVEFGTPIRAADNGVIIHADWYGGYGNCIIIQHENDLSTLYGHCSQLYVHQGEVIKQGQPVGAVGSTGMSTGPHLHFEVRQAGTPVDPLGYL